MAPAAAPAAPDGATGVIALADGTLIWGHGFGHAGDGVGELIFNTAMTGYQEVMTDPSYAGQIITFTFPHIGNVGANDEDVEAPRAHAVGCVVRELPTRPSNFRSRRTLGEWMAEAGLIGIAGVDTRALTRRIRESGAPNAVIAHAPDAVFDTAALVAKARDWPGLEGMDLAARVTGGREPSWSGGAWALGQGYATHGDDDASRPHVVAIDYGAKDNIFRRLAHAGARVTVVPAATSAAEIMALKPAGVFLSNGPGDPAATGAYAVPVLRELMDQGVPMFGICLGHQLLALALGGRTIKMHQGHRGANHPVQRFSDGAVEITSMNHGFAVDTASLPEGVTVTHTSLFDGSNAGFECADKRILAVQYHPEASPGPQDSDYLFARFISSLGVAS